MAPVLQFILYIIFGLMLTYGLTQLGQYALQHTVVEVTSLMLRTLVIALITCYWLIIAYGALRCMAKAQSVTQQYMLLMSAMILIMFITYTGLPFIYLQLITDTYNTVSYQSSVLGTVTGVFIIGSSVVLGVELGKEILDRILR